MRSLTAMIAAVVLGGAAVAGVGAEEPRREAGAHVHGSGKLGIAIEGSGLSFDLDAPAHDILGFEHAPKTAAERAALDKAVATLKDAGNIFRPNPEAGCRLTTAEAGLEQPETGDAAKADAKGDKGGHADFNGNFTFECSAIDKLTSIAFGYFAAFPEAEKLEVTLLTAKGQATRIVSKSSPSIDVTRLD